MNEPRPHTEAELLDLMRSIDVEAPEALHRRVEAMIAEQDRPGHRPATPAWALAISVSRSWRLGGAVALAAALAAALVVGLSGGGSSTAALNVREAAALTGRGAITGAPLENPRNGAKLAASVDGVAFPYWEERFGWRATGARSDRVAGRAVKTVFYANDRGQRIGYAIVAGAPAPAVKGGTLASRGGTPYRLLSENGAPVVTWQREGRLCIVSGRGVSSATLLRLASWQDSGQIAA
jgi:hypothetical protein